MRILLIPILLLFVGCASWNLHSICVDGVGNNITTPYGGPVSGKIRLCTVTCLGYGCPKANIEQFEEITNAVNPRSTTNTSN
jgi:hypothetical protein